MAVTLMPVPNALRLSVVGDIEAVLVIAAAPPELFDEEGVLIDTYYISLSDGSLIRASLDEHPQFEVVVEGAGKVSFDKAGKSLTVDWDIEWINLASNRAATALAHKSPRSVPLFDGLISAAA